MVSENPDNPAKYERESERIQTELGAEAIALVVINGRKGHGATISIKADCMHLLPGIAQGLEALLEQVRISIANGPSPPPLPTPEPPSLITPATKLPTLPYGQFRSKRKG